MSRPILIAPSILSADFACLAAEIEAIERGGADVVHVDVMDGHFVPSITIGPPVVKKLRQRTSLPLDCHLMISDPATHIPQFIEAGADWISFHLEALAGDPARALLVSIRSAGKRAGLVINPDTAVQTVRDYVDYLDYLLVMSVWPGKAGQSFIEEVRPKIPEAAALLAEAQGADLQIDGGIDPGNVGDVARLGANVIVAGSSVFSAGDPPEKRTALLKRLAREGSETA